MVKTLVVEGMSCGHCVMALKKELMKLNCEVKEVEIGKALIEVEEGKVSDTEINAAVDEAGFKLVEIK